MSYKTLLQDNNYLAPIACEHKVCIPPPSPTAIDLKKIYAVKVPNPIPAI